MLLIYDGACPICSAYARNCLKTATADTLTLTDIRTDSDMLNRLHAENIDINEGMVLYVEDACYTGAAAMHILASRNLAGGRLRWLHQFVFSRPALGERIYPLLRTGRNALLWLRGIPQMPPPKCNTTLCPPDHTTGNTPH